MVGMLASCWVPIDHGMLYSPLLCAFPPAFVWCLCFFLCTLSSPFSEMECRLSLLSSRTQLCLVYLFEYVVSVGTSQISNTSLPLSLQNRDFILLTLFYQIGVFISRSSILFKLYTSRFFLLTTLQGINFVIWQLHCRYVPHSFLSFSYSTPFRKKFTKSRLFLGAVFFALGVSPDPLRATNSLLVTYNHPWEL